MTTQQPAALWIAYELEIGTFVPNVLQNEIVLRQSAAAELRRQHARITELESQLAQRFDAADMATAAAQGFRDGAASVVLASTPAQAAEPSITLDFKMATDLLGMFGGEPGLVTLQRGDEHGHSGPGLYAWYSDMPEEGAGFLGAEPDDEATPSAPSAPAQPVVEQGVDSAALPDEREAFEAMMRSQTFDSLKRLSDGSYESYEARVGWLAWNVRASHGQAPAGATTPTEQQILEAAEKAGLWPNTVHSWIPAFHRYHKELAKAQPAQARADSVLEDAARYRWLRDTANSLQSTGPLVFNAPGDGSEMKWTYALYGAALDNAVDAARKQGDAA
jgi:hypothetical protein